MAEVGGDDKNVARVREVGSKERTKVCFGTGVRVANHNWDERDGSCVRLETGVSPAISSVVRGVRCREPTHSDSIL